MSQNINKTSGVKSLTKIVFEQLQNNLIQQQDCLLRMMERRKRAFATKVNSRISFASVVGARLQKSECKVLSPIWRKLEGALVNVKIARQERSKQRKTNDLLIQAIARRYAESKFEKWLAYQWAVKIPDYVLRRQERQRKNIERRKQRIAELIERKVSQYKQYMIEVDGCLFKPSGLPVSSSDILKVPGKIWHPVPHKKEKRVRKFDDSALFDLIPENLRIEEVGSRVKRPTRSVKRLFLASFLEKIAKTPAGNVLAEVLLAAIIQRQSVSVYYPKKKPSVLKPLVENQMDTVAKLLNTGSDVLSVINRDFNRDNPTLPLQPVGLVPKATTSFCYMDHIPEPLDSLRADPRGQTPHPYNNNEMSIDYITQKEGFLETIVWKTSHEKDSLLWSDHAVPLKPLEDNYPKSEAGKILPPIAYAASFFSSYRGELTYVFEVCALAFYTGRLLVVAVPMDCENPEPSIAKVKGSVYKEYDIESTSRFEFSVPWNWKNAFCPVRSTAIDFECPCKIYMFVTNQLNRIENIPESVYINVYIKAGNMFELAIPRPTSLVASDEKIPEPTTEYLIPYNLESKVYSTYNSSCKASNGKYPVVLYIQNVVNGFLGYTNLTNPYAIYRLQAKTTKQRDFRVQAYRQGALVNVNYGVWDPALSTANAHGLVCFAYLSLAEQYVSHKRTKSIEEARVACLAWEKDGPWSEIKVDGKWVPASDTNDPLQWKFEKEPVASNDVLDFEIVLPQMDTEGAAGTSGTVIATGSNTQIESVQPIDVSGKTEISAGFKAMSLSKESQTYKSMVERGLFLGTYTWSTQEVGKKVVSFKVPYSVIKENLDSQNAQMFLTHRFYRTDMYIVIKLNSNKFQLGCLKACVMYQDKTSDITPYDNVYSAMQRDHVTLMAGSSNDGKLYIPYQSRNSMNTFLDKEDFAVVDVFVLNQLATSSTVAKSCTISATLFFENTEFSGMINRTEPQVLSVPVTRLVASTQSSKQGIRVFGERSPDFKSITRRYNYFGSFVGHTSAMVRAQDAPYIAKLRVFPKRYYVQANTASADVRLGPGNITAIAEMYKFYRGSMRFKFSVVGNTPEGCQIFLMYRQDRYSDSEEPLSSGPTKVRTKDDLLNFGYSVACQSLNVNGTGTIEVPYYQPLERSTLLRDGPRSESDNGLIYIWLQSKTEEPIQIEFYYAMGDDAHFSTFIGTPPVIDLETFAPEPQMDIEPQGLTDKVVESIMNKKEISEITSKTSEAIDKVNKTNATVEEVVVKMGESTEVVTSRLTLLLDKLTKITDSVSAKFGNIFNKDKVPNNQVQNEGLLSKLLALGKKSLIYLIYMIISPTIPIIAFSLFNIFTEWFGGFPVCLTKLTNLIKRLWRRCFPSQQSQESKPSSDKVEPQDDMNSDCVVDFAKVLFMGLTTMCSVKAFPLVNFANIGRNLFMLSHAARGASAVAEFISDMFRLFKRVIRKFMSYFGSSSATFKIIAGLDDERVKTWISEAMYVVSPQVLESERQNPRWADKIYELSLVGKAIYAELIKTTAQSPKLTRIVFDNLREISKIERELIHSKTHTAIRYEPYVLWLCGDAGTGKSKLAEDLSCIFAKEHGHVGASIHCLTAGQKYFDGFQGQPTVGIDDFGCMPVSTSPDMYAMFLQMKSSMLFNPPFAHVDDKSRVVNFHNLIITSNKDSMVKEVGIADTEAYDRRRDLLLKFKYNPGWNALRVKKASPEELASWPHLTVLYAENPVPVNEVVQYMPIPRPAEDSGHTYKDVVYNKIMDSFRWYHSREAQKYLQRAKRLEERVNAAAAEADNFDSRLRSYCEAFQSSNAHTFSDYIKKWIQQTKDIVTFKVNRSPQIVVGPLQIAEALAEPGPSSAPVEDVVGLATQIAEPQGEEIKEKARYRALKDDLLSGRWFLKWQKHGLAGQKSMYKSLRRYLKNLNNANTKSLDAFVEDSTVPIPAECIMEKMVKVGFITASCITSKLADPKLWENELWPNTDAILEGKVENEMMDYGFSSVYKNCCLHENFDFSDCTFDKTYKVFATMNFGKSKKPSSCLAGPCRIWNVEDKKWIHFEGCKWTNPYFRAIKAIEYFLSSENEQSSLKQMNEICLSDDVPEEGWQQEFMPSYWSSFIHHKHEKILEGSSPFLQNHIVNLQIKTAQMSLQQSFEDIPDIGVAVAKKAPRSMGSKLYSLVISVLKILFKLVCLAIFIVVLCKGVNGVFNLVSLDESSAFGLAGGIGSLVGIGAGMSMFAKPSNQLQASGDYKTIKPAASIRQRALKMVSEAQNQQSLPELHSDSQFNAICNKIVSNSFFMCSQLEDGRVIKARCFGIYNKKFIVLKHFIEHFRSLSVKEVDIVTYQGRTVCRVILNDIEFQWTPQGYGVGDLPKSFPTQFKKLTHLMPSESFGSNYPTKAIFLETEAATYKNIEIDIKLLNSSVTVSGTGTQSPWTIDQGFSYKYGGKGKCGSLILSPLMACPIIGIHTAGIGDKVGYAEVLLKETFVDESPVVEYAEVQSSDFENVYELDGMYAVEGKVDQDLIPKFPNKTRIEPSEIHGVFPIKTEPAPLRGDDPRLDFPADILKIAVSKRCDPIIRFNKEDIQLALKDYKSMVFSSLFPVRAQIKPLTISEVVSGMEIQGYEPMVMSTSEGFPWTSLRPKGASNKSWLFKMEDSSNGRQICVGIWKDLITVIEEKDKLRSMLIVPKTYYTACLKDARVLKEKVSIPGKTRCFEMSPVDLTISQNQYFKDFSAAYTTARFSAENTIGINPDGKEWSYLANSLIKFSPHILTADYSSYGPRASHDLLELAFDVRTEWLASQEICSEEEQLRRRNVREVIKHEVVHGLHVCKNLIFRPSSGLPSGNTATVELNSEINSMYIRIAFLGLARRYCPGLANIDNFRRFVLMFSNGDDLIISVKPEIIQWFNNCTLIDFFAEYNLKMTDALKTSGEIRPFCSILEATYLKRAFYPHPTRDGEWLSPLEISSVTDTANWVWKSLDKHQMTLVNSEMACRLAYTHGPIKYLEVCKTIQNYWLAMNVQFSYPSWEDLDNAVWANGEPPKFCF